MKVTQCTYEKVYSSVCIIPESAICRPITRCFEAWSRDSPLIISTDDTISWRSNSSVFPLRVVFAILFVSTDLRLSNEVTIESIERGFEEVLRAVSFSRCLIWACVRDIFCYNNITYYKKEWGKSRLSTNESIGQHQNIVISDLLWRKIFSLFFHFSTLHDFFLRLDDLPYDLWALSPGVPSCGIYSLYFSGPSCTYSIASEITSSSWFWINE